MKGKVYIAGAGPGDLGLVTLKTKEVLEKAEVVIYDRLINKRLLSFCKKETEMIYLGKGSKDGGTLQDTINKTIIEKALEGKIVVRLHGGDPFIFGRGGEEAEGLFENGIEFEIIPGISSSIAVPAYAGIPVTMRGFSSNFHLFTGKNKEGKLDVDFEALSKFSGTSVFLMGVESLETIVSNMISKGFSKEMTAALIQQGTTGYQKKVTGTLENIVEKARTEKIEPPAIFIVSKTVEIHEKLKWFEDKSLMGKKIVVTRNKDGFENAADIIEKNGGIAIEFSMIDIVYSDKKEMDGIFQKIFTADTLIINSANGVKSIMSSLFDLGYDIRRIAKQKIGIIGDATEKEIKKYGIIPDIKPVKYTAESVLAEAVAISKPGEKIIVATSDISPMNIEELNEKYSQNLFEKVNVYKTIPVDKTEIEFKELLSQHPDYITFLSSSAVVQFFENVKKYSFEIPTNTKIASIGPVTSKTIKSFGAKVDIEADIYTVEGLIDKICKIEMNFK